MLNIHPSLLPAFPGLHTHARALAAGVKLHGCTVHLVTEAMDEGPILAQAAVPVLPGDTEDTLAARVLRRSTTLSGGARGGGARWLERCTRTRRIVSLTPCPGVRPGRRNRAVRFA